MKKSIYGDKVIIIPFDRAPVLDTEDDWITVWSIFSETKYPEEAVKVLELLYNDEEVLNVILYGVEGLHYEVEEDGSFSFPDGVTENNVGYTCSVKWQFNTPKAGIWSGMSEDLEKDFAEFEASAEVSPAYGFWLDESKITVDMQKIKGDRVRIQEVSKCGNDRRWSEHGSLFGRIPAEAKRSRK